MHNTSMRVGNPWRATGISGGFSRDTHRRGLGVLLLGLVAEVPCRWDYSHIRRIATQDCISRIYSDKGTEKPSLANYDATTQGG